MLSAAPSHPGTGAGRPGSPPRQPGALLRPTMPSPGEVVARADAIAVSVGSKITMSTLMLGCVLAIVIGAASLLDAVHQIDSDLKVMSKELQTANNGTKLLNGSMASLPPTRQNMQQVVETVAATSAEVKRSDAQIRKLNARTGTMYELVTDISMETQTMGGTLQELDASAARLDGTLNGLSARIDPIASTQRRMLMDTRAMKGGVVGMNDSLAYVVRVLNYLGAPPTGGGFTARVDLPPNALPRIPGVRVQTDPVEVFPRNPWPVYNGR